MSRRGSHGGGTSITNFALAPLILRPSRYLQFVVSHGGAMGAQARYSNVRLAGQHAAHDTVAIIKQVHERRDDVQRGDDQ